MSGVRADVRLVELGLAPSREKARTLIMAGEVFIDTLRIDKPGAAVPEDALLTVKEQAIPFVSRGGLKLDKAVRKYGLDFTDMVTMDVGASTGGFTDCMLQNGAAKVYAVDVGTNQLAWKLRSDERVVNMERTNVRYLEADSLPEKVDVVTIDVAFISLDKVLPAVKKIIADDGIVIALIKPQFEAGKENVGKKGVVRDPQVHLTVINNVIATARELGFKIAGLDYSPVKGPEGNIEYLLYLKNAADAEEIAVDPDETVKKSHLTLDTSGK